MEYFGIACLLVLVTVLLTALTRANELFCLSFRRGKVLVVRGAVPGPVLGAFLEVLSHPMAENALVKGFLGEVRLTVAGVDAEQVQRLRNAFGLFPAPSSVPRRRNLAWWQFVGFVWLAWWMEGRDEDPPEDPPQKSNIVPFKR